MATEWTVTTVAKMTGAQVADARVKLGRAWGLKRTLSPIELARALGLSPKNGNDHVNNMESGKSKVSGPIELLIRHYLNGALPFDDQLIIIGKGHVWPKVVVQEAIEPAPAVPRARAKKKAAEKTA